MKLDFASTALLAQLAAMGGPGFHEMSPEEARLAGAGISNSYPPGPDMVSVREEMITGSDGASFRARVLIPNENPRAAIVYYHGGLVAWPLGDVGHGLFLLRARECRGGNWGGCFDQGCLGWGGEPLLWRLLK